MTATSPNAPDAGRRLTHRHADQPLRGIALIVLSTVFLACSDTLAKYLGRTVPPIEIGWIRFLVFVLIMMPVALMSSASSLRSARPKLQVLRGLALVASSTLFISGLQFLPIAEASATSFVAPLFVTALSIVMLGESIGIRRWAASVVGLIGVLIVIRPGSAAFNPAVIFPILSALTWAVTLILTRMISGADRAIVTMTFSALVGFVALSVIVPFVWVTPSWEGIMLGVLVGLASTMGQWIVVLAYRYADASVLAPFTYSQLVWVTFLGFGLFGEVPDVWTFVGAAVIIASGLYTAHRERLRRKQPVAAEPYPSP
ncbi:DMT family transporter [Rhodopseudomonas palustris]|uniref:DMT family transporter n=1 Tax=Rhodopseudomonas palustris TaxID=1076 RepID=A0A418VDB0_RHOPL|nr:DMT family transporter [Rhodopseudomonas palustris]RJF73970.1 DMT family transporter [Rhodopseudomonas palustris]